METSKRRQIPTKTCVQISASEAFTKRKISHFFVVFVSTSVTLRETTSVMFLNYTLVSSGNHIQNIQIVCAHMRDFTMVTAGRAFGPDRAAPGIRCQLHHYCGAIFAVLAILSIFTNRRRLTERFASASPELITTCDVRGHGKWLHRCSWLPLWLAGVAYRLFAHAFRLQADRRTDITTELHTASFAFTGGGHKEVHFIC